MSSLAYIPIHGRAGRAARPVVRDLEGTAGKLADATPSLQGVFTQLNAVLNMVAFNPNGGIGQLLGAYVYESIQ